jgi:hypothetical protein
MPGTALPGPDRFAWWRSPAQARALGCTHHARLFGLVPGFIEPVSALWVPRADWLNPVEDLLTALWVGTRLLRGEEPDFMIAVGAEIA